MTVKAAIDRARAATRATPTDLAFDGGSYSSDYRVQLIFKEYSLSAARSGNISSKGTGAGSVTLPMPVQLLDAYGIAINSNQLGALGDLAATAMEGSGLFKNIGSISGGSFSEFAASSLQAATAAGQGVYNAINSSALGNAAAYMARRGLSQINEGVGAGVSVGLGTALNPHAALVFEGVNLKNYTMSWQLAPRSEKEAETIRSIINTIKVNMHPEYEVGKGFLKYPSLFQPSLQGANPSHTITFKPGFIKDLQIDYSPNGLSFNRGGIPSTVNFSISFEEAQIRTREDFNGTRGAPPSAIGTGPR